MRLPSRALRMESPQDIESEGREGREGGHNSESEWLRDFQTESRVVELKFGAGFLVLGVVCRVRGVLVRRPARRGASHERRVTYNWFSVTFSDARGVSPSSSLNLLEDSTLLEESISGVQGSEESGSLRVSGAFWVVVQVTTGRKRFGPTYSEQEATDNDSAQLYGGIRLTVGKADEAFNMRSETSKSPPFTARSTPEVSSPAPNAGLKRKLGDLKLKYYAGVLLEAVDLGSILQTVPEPRLIAPEGRGWWDTHLARHGTGPKSKEKRYK
ncbi:hypothetical protein AAG570_001971 [Ranatra chinensis]|uniref:Uncharacterized protein n=1 Tax=Ranatra chinensis TaxID=642074 RepID=A0ABD0YA18_9HEMI